MSRFSKKEPEIACRTQNISAFEQDRVQTNCFFNLFLAM